MKLRYTYILLFLALVISGCSESVSTGGSSVIMPLKEGNRWIYQYTIYDSLGLGVRNSTDTLYLGAPSAKGNQNWYPVLYMNSSDPSDTTFYFNKPDGMWEFFFIPTRI